MEDPSSVILPNCAGNVDFEPSVVDMLLVLHVGPRLLEVGTQPKDERVRKVLYRDDQDLILSLHQEVERGH